MSLLYNEGSQPIHKYGHYELYDVSDLFGKQEKGALPIFTLIHKELADRPDMYYPGYVERVYKGIPAAHREAFLATNGVMPTKTSKLNLYRYLR
jgi:hypothetical protein